MPGVGIESRPSLADIVYPGCMEVAVFVTKGNASSNHSKPNMDREKDRYPELSDFGGGGG